MTPLLFVALFAPFPHRPHVTAARLKCVDCHTAPAKFGGDVSYPGIAKCALCHAAIARDKPIPSARVYKLASFVYFDHRFHLMNNVQCEDCHGAEAGRDSTKMNFCQPCHVKTRAATGCNTCHEIR